MELQMVWYDSCRSYSIGLSQLSTADRLPHSSYALQQTITAIANTKPTREIDFCLAPALFSVVLTGVAALLAFEPLVAAGFPLVVLALLPLPAAPPSAVPIAVATSVRADSGVHVIIAASGVDKLPARFEYERVPVVAGAVEIYPNDTPSIVDGYPKLSQLFCCSIDSHWEKGGE